MVEAEVFEALPQGIARAENLPSPPAVAVEVLRLSDDERATIDALTGVLSRDPVLSARILKLANSALFRRGDEVTSLEMATMRLGIKTVKLMALSFSLTSNLPRKSESRGFDYGEFWRRSLTIAVASRSLARLVHSPYGDEAFLCGLLSRLGQLVMAQCIPGRYGQLIEETGGQLPSAAQEFEQLGYDFHRVGGALLRSWELPDLIVQAIRHWGRSANLELAPDATLAELVRILGTADLIGTMICESRRGSALRTLYQMAEENFGVSQDETDALVVSLEEDVGEIASMLSVDLDQESYQSIIDRARVEMVQISLDTARDLEEQYSRAEELARLNQELASQATMDRLTGIPNRAHFDETLERTVKARLAGGSRSSLGVLILDVDHFKRFNDTHGHPAGDEVLKQIGECLEATTRDTDLAARYGGEEFVVIVANATVGMLHSIAERVRTRIEATPLQREGRLLSMTASIGGACVEPVRSERDGPALLALADRCLYEAKRGGRNRSVVRQVETTARTSGTGH